MGCTSSKSTPVVDSINNGTNDLKQNSNGLLKKGKDAVKGMADEICEMGHNASQKIGSLTDHLKSSQPNTPETERAQRAGDASDEDDEMTGGSPKMPVRILSIDVDEDNKDELRDNQVPVKLSLSIGDSDNEAGGEKPPTPMPEDDCLNRNGGRKNACTCYDDSDSDTCFETMRTNRSQNENEDACCAESVELNFNDRAADNDDCNNQNNTCSDDACATGDQKTREDEESQQNNSNCESKDDACAQLENNDDECQECQETKTDGRGENQYECNNCDDNDCADDNECEDNQTDNCADNNKCAGNEADFGADDNDECADDKCARNEKEFCADESEDCTQTANTGTLQSECSQGGCTCGSSGADFSCADTNTEDGCGSENTLCANCADQMGTMKSNYSESTVRSNSFECLNMANDEENTWGNKDTYRSGYSKNNNNVSTKKNGSCLVCMGTGTVRSRSAYADTMDSSYSQQYGNCAMQSARADTMRSQESDSQSESEGDAKASVPCFNICSCLGQNLIQLQLR